MSRKRTRAGVPLPEPKRCAIYTRKSTAIGLEQEFNSLDAQREACEKYIEGQGHQGWRVIPEHYDDGGFTGANLERPAFIRLMDDMDAGKLDVIVVYKVDRLSRSLLDFAKVMDRFNNAGVAFVSVTQNFSTADAMGRLTLNMLMSFAEFEREMIAERTRDKIAAARRKGKWTGGAVPLGYDVVDKHLVVNDLEAVLVREIFDLYLHHRSSLAVTKILNDTGRFTKRHLTKDGKLKRPRPWAKDAVLRVLRNPVYAGYIPYKGEVHEGEHDAIVEREVFTRTQTLIDGNGVRKLRKGANPTYLLRGILRCACCGRAYTPGSTTKNSGKEYRYYRCVTRDKYGKRECPARPLPADAIEEFVVERIREAALGGDLALGITSELQDLFEGRRKDLLTERQALPTEIARLSREGHKLVESLGTTNGTAHRLLEDRIEELGEQIARSESRLYQVERALAELKRTEIEASWVADALGHFDDVWDVLTVENQARLVAAVVQEVVVDDLAGTVSAELVDLTGADLGGLLEDEADPPPGRDTATQREAEARP